MSGGNSKQDKAQRKALEKQKQKIIEDKTFGLKNKKSKSVQKYIKSVQQQVTGQPPKSSDKHIAQQTKEKQEKQRIQQQQALIASLFKSTENARQAALNSQKEAYDPKKSRSDQKIDVYCDQRIQRAKDDENMTTWDLGTLEGIIAEKHGSNLCKTDIICKHFLNAVETKKYGWFWVCPNGGDNCKYRHCLPPGFVLNNEVPKEIEDGETLEEKIERERAALPEGGEMVTAESLARWRAKKEEMRLGSLKDSVTKGESIKLTGKDLFTFNPALFMDDEGAAVELDYEEAIDIDEIIRQNEESLIVGNVLPDSYKITNGGNSADDFDSVEIGKLSL